MIFKPKKPKRDNSYGFVNVPYKSTDKKSNNNKRQYKHRMDEHVKCMIGGASDIFFVLGALLKKGKIGYADTYENDVTIRWWYKR